MCNEDLARVCRMLFVSSFRILIASLLGDALDAGSSCSFGFASTRLFGCGSFARRKTLCSKFLFYFVVHSTFSGVVRCRRSSTTRASFPCCITVDAQPLGVIYSLLLALVPLQPGRRAFLSTLSIYTPAGPALSGRKFLSPMSTSDPQLVEPLSLVKAPSSPLHDLSKVSSIWMLVFFYYPRI